MTPNLTPDQINQLRSLGIFSDPVIRPMSKLEINSPSNILSFFKKPKSSTFPKENNSNISSLHQESLDPLRGEILSLPKERGLNFLPLISIAGITLISFSGIILLKNQSSNPTPVAANNSSSTPVQNASPTSTPAPVAIQSYLLSSQQYFTQALQLQKTDKSNNEQIINLLNQSILAASEAIKHYPGDYRAHYQRGHIYQSLIDSKPDLISQAIIDFSTAASLNPNSADITRDLASLFARKGDVDNTLTFLSKTVSLEPTKAQNFYDLAKIQQQTGRVQDALSTYNRLIPLISDPTQLAQVQAEKTTLEQIIAQNPKLKPSAPISSPTTNPNPDISFPDNPPNLQASAGGGLIIAAPETSKKIEIENVTNSNSLSGTATLPTNQKEISIKNTNLKSTSQVYLTILKGGKNQTLQLISKNETTFTVGLDSAIPEAIEFKWWIIN